MGGKVKTLLTYEKAYWYIKANTDKDRYRAVLEGVTGKKRNKIVKRTPLTVKPIYTNNEFIGYE